VSIFGTPQAIEAAAPPAPSAPPAPPPFDPDDYDARWHAALAALAAEPGVVLTPGEEVTRGGRVLDLDLATVTRRDRSAHLVALDTPLARDVGSALEAQGVRVVRVRADMPDVVARVVAALEP